MRRLKRLTSGLLIVVAISTFASTVVANRRQDVPPKAPRLTDQQSAVSVRTEEVKFVNLETQLIGTLFLPKQAVRRRFPAVLLISGSDQGSDAKIGIARAPRAAFKELAGWLVQKGIAVYRYDNRCAGASGCKPNATPQDHNEDALAALKMLSQRAEIDPARIVVIGHDEGGIFASHVAAPVVRSPAKVIGLVTIGMPGRIYPKILREQEQRRLIAEGKSQAEVTDYLAQFDRLAASISSGSVDAAALRIDANDPLFKPIIGNVHYFFNQFLTDPLQVIRGVKVPVLILQGAKDANVEVRDANYLNEIQKGQYNPDLTMTILPEMDHWMREQKGATTLTIDEPSRPLDSAFLAALNEWLAKRFK